MPASRFSWYVRTLDGDEREELSVEGAPREACALLAATMAEIEHATLVRYQYLRWSLSASPRPPVDAHAREFVRAARDLLAELVREQLGHLLSLQNVLCLLGAAPRLSCGPLLAEASLVPAPFWLEPFDRSALCRAIVACAGGDLGPVPTVIREGARVPHDGCEAWARRVDALHDRLRDALALLPADAARAIAPAFQHSRWGELRLPSPRSMGAAWDAVDALARGRRAQVARLVDLHARMPDVALGWPAPVDPHLDPSSIEHPRSAAWAELAALRATTHAHAVDLAWRVARDRRGLREDLSSAALDDHGRFLEVFGVRLAQMPRREGTPPHVASAAVVPALLEPISDEGSTSERLRRLAALHARASARVSTLLDATTDGEERAVLMALAASDDARVERWLAAARELESDAGRLVVVVGAGPAGLAAAAALAQRGVRVRLVEAAKTIGGKVSSAREGGLSVEHGVHGWWPGYRNFDRLLRWAGVELDASLKPTEGSTLVLEDGRRFGLRILPVDLPSPLFLILQNLRTPFLTTAGMRQSWRFFVHLLAFDHARDYDRFDPLSVGRLMEWCQVSRDYRALIFEPFMLSYDFAMPDRVSAASAMSGMQFYFLRDQRCVLPRWSRGLPYDNVFGPIERKLRAEGVEISLGCAATRVCVEGSEVRGIVLRSTDASAPGGAPATTVPLDAIPDRGFTKVGDDGAYWVGRFGDEHRVLRNRCTHMGCPVDWAVADRRFHCPCHGSAFAEDGAVVNGPATTPLPRVEAKVRDRELEIAGGGDGEVVACDDVVLAVDLEAARRVLDASDGVPASLRASFSRLDTTPVITARFWFEGVAPVRAPLESAIASGMPFADNFFDLACVATSYLGEGRIIEVQSAHDPTLVDRSDAELRELALADVRRVYPDLAEVEPSHAVVQRHRAVFTRFGPGQEPHRPGVETGVAGLHLAGDWTSVPYAVWMMERAIVTGERAASAALARRGLAAFESLRLEPEHWMLRATRALARAVRDRLLADPTDRVMSKVIGS